METEEFSWSIVQLGSSRLCGHHMCSWQTLCCLLPSEQVIWENPGLSWGRITDTGCGKEKGVLFFFFLFCLV